MRMEGVGFRVCKADYLETYRSLLLLLKVYRGEVIVYEELISGDRQGALACLQRLAGASWESVCSVVDEHVGSPRSSAEALSQDSDCRAVYDQLVALASVRGSAVR